MRPPRKWRKGRRDRFRAYCPQGRGGSNPPFRTVTKTVTLPDLPFPQQPRCGWIGVEPAQQGERCMFRIGEIEVRMAAWPRLRWDDRRADREHRADLPT